MGERIINGIPFDANAIIDQEGEISYDYTLFAEDIAQWLGTYFGNGILVPKAALMTTQFQVSMANETQISINKGNIVINGRTGYLKNPYEMSIDYASVGKQRIDRIVIELNINETVNEFRPLVLKGVESEKNPQIPDITRDNYLGIYQMSLANVLVTADGIQKITDERNDSNLCGVSQVLIGVKPAVPVTGDSALNISYDTSYTGVEEKTVQDALDNLYLTKKKILLNGVDQQELKLSTKYQWVDGEQIDFGDYKDVYSAAKRFINFKNETHIFTNDLSNNHFKLVDGVLVADVDRPSLSMPSGFKPKNWVCADDNYIYAFGTKSYNSIWKITVLRFDGSAWEEFFVLTPKSGQSETIYNIGIPSVHSNKLYLTAYTEYNSTYYKYAGYIDLSTKEWVDLPTLPVDALYSECVFTEIDGILYLIGDTKSYNRSYIGFYMLNASSNSWTSLNVKIPFSNVDFSTFDLLTVNNKAYFTISRAFCYFDGPDTVKLVSTTKNLENPSLLFNNEFTLYGTVKELITSSISGYIYNSIQSFKKVLCLED